MAALYGSASLTWQLSTRWTSLLGGQRALLMQVAHPSVGAGVAEHSDFTADPFRRLDRTLNAVMTIGFGTDAERASMLDTLDRVHAGVAGTTAAGDPYTALDPELQFWVHATLVDTVLCIERRYLRILTRTERARLYLESVALAGALGIPDRQVPGDLDTFRAYMDEMNRSLEPSEQSRAVARSVLRPGLRLLPDPLLVPFAWATLEMLPRPLRRAYGYRDLAPPQLAAVRAGQLAARTTLPRLPEPLLRLPGTDRFLDRAA